MNAATIGLITYDFSKKNSTSSIMHEGHQSSHYSRACDMGSLLLQVIKSFGMGFDTSCEDDGGNCEVSRIQIYIY